MSARLMIRESGLSGCGDANEEAIVLELAKLFSDDADRKVYKNADCSRWESSRLPIQVRSQYGQRQIV